MALGVCQFGGLLESKGQAGARDKLRIGGIPRGARTSRRQVDRFQRTDPSGRWTVVML